MFRPIYTQAVFVVLGASLVLAGTPPAAAATADDLLIVDCLLPGQVRQLGQRVTYVSRRQAVKTTASECEIRGGEYVKADRASFSQSLKVWLPLAKEGDPEAQNYVGEIYEKGLGVAPQYGIAAEWYAKAAEQNYAPAQINLGTLYERGLGVPQDKAKAVELYRKASGLETSALPYVPATAQVPANETEIARYQEEAQAARQRADKIAERLKSAEDALEAQRSATRAQEATEKAAKVMPPRPAVPSRQEKELAALKAELSEAKNRAAEYEQQIASLQAEDAAQATEVAQAPPEIEIIDPPVPVTRSAGDPTIQISASPERTVVGRVKAPAGLIALIVNDRNIEADADGLFKTNVAVAAPETPVTVVAIDGAGRRTARRFVLEPPAEMAQNITRTGNGEAAPLVSPAEFGNFYALVIGNNAYTQLPPLQSARNDAKAVARLLREKYGFEVKLLLDASRYEILSALNNYREKLTEEDNLLLYYAGHGELDRINNRGHWLPIDAEPNSTANWISNIQITDILNAMAARQVMIVADSCYSGTMTRAALARIDPAMSESARSKWLKAMADKRARVVLSSGGVQPVLDTGRGDHSVFANAFLLTLDQNAGVLEGQGLYQKVSAAVTDAASSAAIEQIPQYAPIKYAGHEAGDFFFIPVVN